MREWDELYPQYGLARGKGYGTPEHLAALAEFGPTPHHRFTFEPVSRFLPPRQMELALALAAPSGAYRGAGALARGGPPGPPQPNQGVRRGPGGPPHYTPQQ